MEIKLNKNTKAPLYQQIKNQIVQQILSGVISAGDILPSERQLAEQLEINRSTVNKAYWELKSEGFINAQIGSGTLVAPQYTRSSNTFNAYVPPLPWNQIMTQPHQLTSNTIIKTALEAIRYPDTISFAGGFAGNDLLPTEMVGKFLTNCIEKYTTKIMHPTPLLGLTELRTSLCKQAIQNNIHVNTSECMITSGAQQALSYITELLISPGDMVFTASPSYVGAIEIFRAHGAKVVGIPTDQFGIDTEILENYLLRYRPKLIYLNPNFQNPTGTFLPLERRQKILELAYLYQIPIIEDDPYSEIFFEPTTIPTLKALDKHQYVIYISTFSKVLFMGGRIVWVFASEEIIQRLGILKQITDLHANTLHQFLMYEIVESGQLSQHLACTRLKIKAKQDIMVDAFKKHNIPDLTFSIPTGGFYLWLKLPDHVNPQSFFESCKTLKVAVMPGDPFYPQVTADSTHIRINYTYPDISEIQEGVNRIVEAMRRASKVKTKHSPDQITDLIL